MIFDETFDVQEPVKTSDGAGGYTTSYSDVATDVPGSLNKRADLNRVKELISDIDKVQYDYIIGLSKTVDTIEKGYRVVLGNRNFEVIDPKDEPTSWVLAVMEK